MWMLSVAIQAQTEVRATVRQKFTAIEKKNIMFIFCSERLVKLSNMILEYLVRSADVLGHSLMYFWIKGQRQHTLSC